VGEGTAVGVEASAATSATRWTPLICNEESDVPPRDSMSRATMAAAIATSGRTARNFCFLKPFPPTK
jgi:hypothetical protein